MFRLGASIAVVLIVALTWFLFGNRGEEISNQEQQSTQPQPQQPQPQPPTTTQPFSAPQQ